MCIPAVVCVLGATALAGCGGAEEPSVAAAIAKSGILGGIGEGLKADDDQAEVAELREHEAQTTEERREDREAAEARQVEASQPASEAPEGEG